MDLQQHLRSKLSRRPAATASSNATGSASALMLQSDVTVNCVLYGRISRSDIVTRIQDWTDLLPAFRDHVHSCGIHEARNGQSHLWPYIWKGKDALLVGPAKSGKTTAFLVPLIGAGLCYQQAKQKAQQLSFSLIICPTAESVQKVANQARSLIPANTLRIVAVDRTAKLSQTKPDIRSQLRNGADIVIATPDALLLIMEQSVLSMKHCSRLVFDEADKLLLIHIKSVKQIYLLYLKAGQQRLPEGHSLQSEAVLRLCKTIVVAEKYTEQVADFQTTSHHNGIGVVTDNFEAAIHAKVEFRMHFARSAGEQEQYMLTAVEQALLFLDRVVVACSSTEEAENAGRTLRKLLKQQPSKELPERQVIVVNDDFNIYDHSLLRTKWQSACPPLFIVPDVMFLTFFQMSAIRNAQAVIHCSVPTDEQSRHLFALRFNFMSAHFNNEKETALLSVLILTDENACHAHELTEMYERLALQIPEQLAKLRESSPRGLCRRMASYGHCPFQKFLCHKDHFLVKKQDESLPVAGQVKFFIGNIVTANEFFIRIMETRDNCSMGEWKEWPHQLQDIQSELNELRDVSHESVRDVRPGQMYAIIHGAEVRRVRVLEEQRVASLEHYEIEHRRYVPVFHVDYGSKTQVERRLLIPLTQRLKKIRALAHRAFVTGIKPPENLVSWSPEAYDFVKSMFERDEFHHLSGWVFITASNCMWMEDVKIHQRLKQIAGGIETVGQTFSQALIDKGFAVAAPPPPFEGHNNNQTHLRSDFRIKDQWKTARHAFLPADGRLVDVNLVHFKSISAFWLRLVSFDQCLRRLEKEMLLEDDLIPVRKPQIGLICMQLYSYAGEKSMNRAVIREVKKNGCVDVLYPDHGEEYEVDADTLYEIKKKHIEQLPFQAVKCGLHNVQINAYLDPEFVYDVTRDEDNVYKVLLAKRRTYDPEKNVYSIDLYVKQSESDEQWIYQNIVLPLDPMREATDNDKLIITKPKKISEIDADEDPESHRTAEDKFFAEMDRRAGQYLDQIMPYRHITTPGFTSRSLGCKERSDDVVDDEEQLESEFPPRPVVDYVPGEFDYEFDRNEQSHVIEADVASDYESDDGLDLAPQPDGDDMMGLEFDIRLNENGDPIFRDGEPANGRENKS